VRLITQAELPLSPRVGCQKQPFRWSVRCGENLKVGVVPDQVFALEFKTPDSETKAILYFLEADRGTMPVVRANPNCSSFARKLKAYEASWRDRIHLKRFQFERLRVLTVTSSAHRVSKLQEECSKLRRGHGVFLFTTEAIIFSRASILGHYWQTVDRHKQLTMTS
jgi:hypothetical protein